MEDRLIDYPQTSRTNFITLFSCYYSISKGAICIAWWPCICINHGSLNPVKIILYWRMKGLHLLAWVIIPSKAWFKVYWQWCPSYTIAKAKIMKCFPCRKCNFCFPRFYTRPRLRFQHDKDEVFIIKMVFSRNKDPKRRQELFMVMVMCYLFWWRCSLWKLWATWIVCCDQVGVALDETVEKQDLADLMQIFGAQQSLVRICVDSMAVSWLTRNYCSESLL